MRPVFRRLFDFSALSLSGLCLAHCLALPFAALLLPALSTWVDAEWVHGVFAGFAIPITIAALWGGRRHGIPARPIALATAGLTLLVLGATEWFGKASNTPLTIVGAVLLAAAHTWNWRRHQKAHLLETRPAQSDGGRGPLSADLG